MRYDDFNTGPEYDNNNHIPEFSVIKSLKSVYCNYRGRVTVHDIHGHKVEELSGMLTYYKYIKIKDLTDPNITEYDGMDDFERIGLELKPEIVDETEDINPGFDLSKFIDYIDADYTHNSKPKLIGM